MYSVSKCCFFLSFLLDIFFIYISNVIPFPSSPTKNPPSFPSSPCSPTHPLLLPGPGISLHWGIEPSQDQGTLLPFIDDWLGHPLLHMHLEPWVPPCVFFGWWFSPWELWEYWLVYIVVSPTNTFSSLGPFSSSSIGNPVFCPMDGYEHPLLYLSGTGRASQKTVISGSCQQVLIGIHNIVWVWWLYMEWMSM